VPFRLTGNVEWGLPAPELEECRGLTFWVWPESLWAPISCTAAYLQQTGRSKDDWPEWWCSADAGVYQFIGEDNVFFYGLAEMAMFLGMQGRQFTAAVPEGMLHLPNIIANRHLLFLDKKASSSGVVKPPMARELLNFYTSDQLRAHFLSLGLGTRNISFRPKPFDPKAAATAADPVLKEGNLLSNAFNRAVRSCFYTAQKFYDGKLPGGEISRDVLEQSEAAILDYEKAMHGYNLHTGLSIAADYVRDINTRWTKAGPYRDDCQPELRRQTLLDAFHMVRVAIVLMHPFAPVGTEKVREYLKVGPEIWDWARIFEPLDALTPDPAEHRLQFLPPRVDFFEKHPSQIQVEQ
jgi:methionyl-tRNA synthetase